MSLVKEKNKQTVRDEKLRKILDLHLNPLEGSRYWLEKEKVLGFSIREEIQNENDLWKLGPMNLEDLSRRPVEDFIPQKFLRQNVELVFAETGGATGRPQTTAYFEEEFHKIFVGTFTRVAASLNLFGGGRWFWVGPGGPHIISKAANQISRTLSGSDAFSIDFDPRWYRKLAPESLARERYMEHILSQALNIWSTQKIENLFATPVVLESLIPRLSPELCGRILGIYLGGMPVKPETLQKLKNAFPNAVIISGYGNSLFGVCHDLRDLSKISDSLVYYPHHDRISFRLIPLDESMPDSERLRHEVDFGQRGQVVFHRFDQSYFLANVIERDTALRVPASELGKRSGCVWDGIGDPFPIVKKQFKVEEGIY